MTIVFDFDGTLHRTDAIYGYAVRKALRELSFPVPEDKLNVTDRELSVYLGVNADAMWEAFLPQLPPEQRPELIGRVGSYMIDAIRSGHACLYDGIPEMLDRLKAQGHTLLVLSNCTNRYMEAQKTAHYLEQWFSGFYCSEAYDNAPKEIIFEDILKKHPAPYVMVGDRKSDIQVAGTHHIASVGCRYGYGMDGELSGADAVVARSGDLMDLDFHSIRKPALTT